MKRLNIAAAAIAAAVVITGFAVDPAANPADSVGNAKPPGGTITGGSGGVGDVPPPNTSDGVISGSGSGGDAPPRNSRDGIFGGLISGSGGGGEVPSEFTICGDGGSGGGAVVPPDFSTVGDPDVLSA